MFFFDRNKFYIPTIAIIAISAVIPFVLIFIIALISAIVKHRKYGHKINDLGNGKREIKFGTRYSIDRIVGAISNDGIPDGNCVIYLRNGEKRKYLFKDGIIQRSIKQKPNIAVFIMNFDPNNAGEFLTDITYQNKYGICQTFDILNPSRSIKQFIDLVKQNKEINTIKLQLVNHGSEKSEIHGNNPQNIEAILDEFGLVLNEKGGNIVINNFACFAGNKMSHAYEKKNANIENIVSSSAKKYKNINFIYQKHNNSKTAHSIISSYDDKTKLSGISHFAYNYYNVSKDGKFRKITKAEKNKQLTVNKTQEMTDIDDAKKNDTEKNTTKDDNDDKEQQWKQISNEVEQYVKKTKQME